VPAVKDLSELYNDLNPRHYYSLATIESFDSWKDLILLRVSKNSLYADYNETICPITRHPIPLCRYIPTTPNDVIMLA
jgi:hypothetical protein